jgi:ribosome biogenesis GTPase A
MRCLSKMLLERTLDSVLKRAAFRSPRRYLAQAQVIRTSVPTIYATSEVNPELQLNRWAPVAKTLFSAHTSYLHPETLNYEYPTDGAPEFAFVGRSNVGKSSLVDLLLGGKKIVNVSKEPGCTRSINYYGLKKDSKAANTMAYFVDLPGYGFARKSKEEQQKWTDIIHSYVSTRDQMLLRLALRVFVATVYCELANA